MSTSTVPEVFSALHQQVEDTDGGDTIHDNAGTMEDGGVDMGGQHQFLRGQFAGSGVVFKNIPADIGNIFADDGGRMADCRGLRFSG